MLRRLGPRAPLSLILAIALLSPIVLAQAPPTPAPMPARYNAAFRQAR